MRSVAAFVIGLAFTPLTVLPPMPAIAQQAAAPVAAWRAVGHEPSWILTREGEGMRLERDFGAIRLDVPKTQATRIDAGTMRYDAMVEGRSFSVLVETAVCVDSMTGMPRPEKVSVVHGDLRLSGCGGDPASLLRGREWRVRTLAGAPAMPASPIDMRFDDDGRVFGLATCNRFNAGYVLTGEGLTIGQAMSSLMACPQPEMDQERVFLDLLQRVARFSIAADGGLVLHTGDGRTIEAR